MNQGSVKIISISSSLCFYSSSITVSLPKISIYLMDGSLRRNPAEIPVELTEYTSHICVFGLSLVCVLISKPLAAVCLQFYIEPGTGKKFRSLPAVETYLNGGAVDSEQILANPDGVGFESVAIDPNPPEKVKWVLTGPGGNMFSAHVSGSDVSSSVQKTWSETFVSLIQERV